ncbi:hypothetical protein Sjap_012117 [Stephania japonica]|uniref:Ricin B-like lectin R40G3 n=1 Tax=Stephania japonica TaxID=461633 RepID=A0AAP0NYL1_9MAGN
MEFPFGDPRHHHHHHHRRRRDDDDDEEEEGEQRYPPPNYHQGPPPLEFGYSGPPPPAFRPPGPGYGYDNEPSVVHVSHEMGSGGAYGFDGPDPDPDPNPYPSVLHVSHEVNRPPEESHHHRPHRPHIPSFFGHHEPTQDLASYLEKKPTVRVYTKAETTYSLAIRDAKVILTRSDPNDVFQQWIKDEKYSTRVKDEEGFPSFALVNKGTGQAMKHSIGATHPVQLIPYNPDTLDESILWAESRDLGDGYRTIRMVNNIRLNLDAFNGDKEHGGVHEGTYFVLWEWAKGANQRWKIVPY